jgi:outer membrane lipoprotein carrier protein
MDHPRGTLLLLGALVVLACGGDGDAAESTGEERPVAAAPAPGSTAGDTAVAGRDHSPGLDGPQAAPGGGPTASGGASGQVSPGNPGGGVSGSTGGEPAPGSPAAERPSAGGQGSPGTGPDAPTSSDDRPAAPSASAAESQETVEEVLRATARRYEDVRALQADFEQRLTNTLLGRTTHSAGTLYQRQPDRFLMRFSDPAGDVIVSDGEYFWLYYPSADARQVIRSRRGAGGLDLRSQFVGDPVRRFKATSHGTEVVRGRSTHVITLDPREPVGYRRLKVWIDAADHLVRRFELTEENGNVRQFDLTDLRVNPSLPDDLFRFEPPEGAVVVTG